MSEDGMNPAQQDSSPTGALLAAQRPTIGAGLLPASLERDRNRMLGLLCGAYASILQSKMHNFGLWSALRADVFGSIRTRYREAGLTAAPWNLDALWARVDLRLPSSQPNEHVALVEALLTIKQERFAEHIIYRLATDGNVHIEITGPTGMGKSSCAIALADWIKTILPESLLDHLSFDLSELPTKLSRIDKGAAVIQDEYVATAGEGSRTFLALFANLEDTLRKSQKNLLVLSPRQHDHATMQAKLELILWNREQQFSVFILWLEDHPHGVIALPWAPPDLWDAYGPWKEANVERSVAGHFKDNKYLAKTILRAFEDQRFVDFLVNGVNKPKKTDFQTALEFFLPQMLSGAQSERIVGFMYQLCYNWDRLGEKFEAWFGEKPNKGLETVANKCYKE